MQSCGPPGIEFETNGVGLRGAHFRLEFALCLLAVNSQPVQ